MSITGTVAWFSANNVVTVTGMQVKTKVSSNLLIAEVNQEANFKDNLEQEKLGILEPVSTVDGENFFYTTAGKADGDAAEDKYTAYNKATAATDTTNYGNKFSEDYGVTKDDVTAFDTSANPATAIALGYIDYSFYLRGASTAENQKLSLTKCNLLYGGNALTSGFSWRVGVFALATSANTTVTDDTCAVEGNNITILDMAKSLNQNEVTASVPAADTSVASGYYTDPNCQTAAEGTANGHTTYYQKSGEYNSPKAVSATNAAPTAVTYGTAAEIDSDVDVETVYYKVVVRLWLEGEDVSCTSSTFAALTNSWTLDLAFKLGSDNGVQVISTDPAL